jgi:hypothetical protein
MSWKNEILPDTSVDFIRRTNIPANYHLLKIVFLDLTRPCMEWGEDAIALLYNVWSYSYDDTIDQFGGIEEFPLVMEWLLSTNVQFRIHIGCQQSMAIIGVYFPNDDDEMLFRLRWL